MAADRAMQFDIWRPRLISNGEMLGNTLSRLGRLPDRFASTTFWSSSDALRNFSRDCLSRAQRSGKIEGSRRGNGELPHPSGTFVEHGSTAISHLLGVARDTHVLSGYVECIPWRQLRIRKNWPGLLGKDDLSEKEQKSEGSQNVHRQVLLGPG